MLFKMLDNVRTSTRTSSRKLEQAVKYHSNLTTGKK